MIEVAFYFFSAVLLFSALLVVSVNNPIHAVLMLIFAFFNAAALFIIMGAEYISMTLIIVYVGAVAVLFLFSVMMIDQRDLTKKRKTFSSILPLVAIICCAIFFEIEWAIRHSAAYFAQNDFRALSLIDNVRSIGNVLYTEYFLQFQVSGIILLVAMIGAIILTLRHSKPVRRQQVFRQISRSRSDAVALVEPEYGKGVNL